MANYFIVGGDDRQYGPITAEDIRKWAAEGRLNGGTSAKAESDAEWRPLAKFPEFADLFEPAPAAPVFPAAPAAPIDWREYDYDLDLSGCISGGWNLFKNHFGVLFVGPVIYFLIEIFIGLFSKIPLIGPAFSVANLFLVGPLLAGVYYQFILVNRGEKTAVGDIFSGFRRRFLHLMLANLLIAFLSALCFTPFFLADGAKFLVLLHQMQNAAGDQNALADVWKSLFALMLSSIPWLLVCMIPYLYIYVSFVFTLPLIIDQDMDFWPAMLASHRMVGKHWWLVFGLVVLIILIKLAGFLACCFGILFAIPLGFGALLTAYETIFRHSKKP